jgi:hypothetical protein
MKLLKDYHSQILTKILSVLIIILFTSCASIKSGKYIMLKKGETLSSVAKKLKLKISTLKRHNLKTRKGWLFIPSKIGLIPRLNELYLFHDLEPGQFIWPVPGSKRVSSYYGRRRGKRHDGIDIPAKPGTSIVASADGEVVYSGSKISGYGNMIVVKHDDDYFTVYAHNSRNFVGKGDGVHQGQVIGRVGSTGRSTGPHLHFEVRKNKTKLNPITFVGHALNKTASK